MLDDKYLVWEGGYIIRVFYSVHDEELVKDISSPTLQAVEETLQLLHLFNVENKPQYNKEKLIRWFLDVEKDVFAQKNRPEEADDILYFMENVFDSWFDCSPDTIKVTDITVFYSPYPIYVDILKQYEYITPTAN